MELTNLDSNLKSNPLDILSKNSTNPQLSISDLYKSAYSVDSVALRTVSTDLATDS